MGMVHQQDRHH
jgi:hypothetical protein